MNLFQQTNSMEQVVTIPRGEGDTWQRLIQGGSASALRSNPLLFLYTISGRKGNPFYIPFVEKRYPFHIPTLENCTPCLNPYNEVNEQYFGKLSSIIRRNAKQTTSVIYYAVKRPISLPIYTSQLVKSLPTLLYTWSPFRAEPPSIGQYWE